jgi:hypothetical protein
MRPAGSLRTCGQFHVRPMTSTPTLAGKRRIPPSSFLSRPFGRRLFRNQPLALAVDEPAKLDNWNSTGMTLNVNG